MRSAGTLIALSLVVAACAGHGPPDLSGRWSGWGTVTMHGLSGSYSDSYGKARTTIELRWVGERTLDGRWSEGTYRFGWLKLTLSEDATTLSGTWGADPACEHRPGRPETAPVTWKRTR